MNRNIKLNQIEYECDATVLFKPVVLIKVYPLCRGVDTLSYVILSVGLVSAFLLILTISAVINARATHKLCWATVGLLTTVSILLIL